MYNQHKILLSFYVALLTFSLYGGGVPAAGPSASGLQTSNPSRWKGIANPELFLSPEQEIAKKYDYAYHVLRGEFKPFSTGIHHQPAITHIRNESDFAVRITGRRENGQQIVFHLDKKNQDKKSSDISLDIIEDLLLHGLIIERRPAQLISLAAAQGAITIPSKAVRINSDKEDIEENFQENLPPYIDQKNKSFYQFIVRNHPPVIEQPKYTLIAQIRYIEQSELYGPHHITMPLSHGVLIDFGETDQTKMIDFHQTYPGFTVVIKNKSQSTSGAADNTTIVDVIPTHIDQNENSQSAPTRHVFTKEKVLGTATVGRRGTIAQ